LYSVEVKSRLLTGAALEKGYEDEEDLEARRVDYHGAHTEEV
jgi:hypothetical protein